jgi:hypothetical protein
MVNVDWIFDWGRWRIWGEGVIYPPTSSLPHIPLSIEKQQDEKLFPVRIWLSCFFFLILFYLKPAAYAVQLRKFTT